MGSDASRVGIMKEKNYCCPVKPFLLKDGNPPRNFSMGSEGDFNTTS